jgi:hypothetical protein
MPPNVQSASLPPPTVFRYSLDWRFLLPVADPANIRVAFEEEPGFPEALEQVDIPASRWSLDSNVVEAERRNTHSLALPFGLPVRWASARTEEQIEFYRSARQQICPDGYFLLGFRSSWYSRSKACYHASTPSRVTDQLNRAGFHSIKIFGALPDLRIPEYIFDLEVQAMRFALGHRFRRKPVLLNMLRMLARTIGWARVSDFFPCYFAIATA